MALAATVDGAERESDLDEVMNDLSTRSSRRTPIGVKIGLRRGIVCDSSV